MLLTFLGGVPRNSGNAKSEAAAKSSPSAFASAITTDLDDYLWPTNTDQRITSNFAEFRSTHFHGGIDIGTHDRTGAEVYAARDGYVVSVSVSPYGYGRFLVLRHSDGYYTTYAHLRSFNPTLERLVHDEQMRKGKFSVRLKFEPHQISVRKGELVAYSGESGAGSAHLHFEIRDENFNPVNPLLCPDIKEIGDTSPPIFRQLAVAPLDTKSFVDYEFSPQLFRARYIKRGVYEIPEVIRCTGIVGFEIDAQDKSAASRYMRGIYKIEFQVDGQTLFQSARNKFPVNDTREIGLDYDWILWRQHRGEFEKLYIGQGNTLPFYSSASAYNGVVSSNEISEGSHTFKIFATDFSGNTSELSGTFVLNHPPAVEIRGIVHERLHVFIPNLEKVQSVEIGTRKLSAVRWHTEEFAIKDFTVRHDSLLIPVDAVSYDVVRLTAKNMWGTKSFPSYFFLKRSHGSAHVWIEKEIGDTFLKLSVLSDIPFTYPPFAEVQQGGMIAVVPLHAVTETRYDGVYRLSDSYSGTSFIKAYCETGVRRIEAFDSFEINSITPDHGGTLSSDDGSFVAEFPSGAVYAPMHLQVKKIDAVTYAIEPHDQLLCSGYTVTLHYPTDYDGGRNIALYMRDRGGWSFTHAEHDARSHAFILRNEHSLGTFGLFTDTEAPVIRRWRASRYNSTNRPLFSFSVRDNFSGIDADEINIFMNGERIISEYDPEKRIVFFNPFETVPPGHYSVSIEVKDRAGNAVRTTKSLTVVR